MQHDYGRYVIGNGDLLDLDVFDGKEPQPGVRPAPDSFHRDPLVPVACESACLTVGPDRAKIAEVLESNDWSLIPKYALA